MSLTLPGVAVIGSIAAESLVHSSFQNIHVRATHSVTPAVARVIRSTLFLASHIALEDYGQQSVPEWWAQSSC